MRMEKGRLSIVCVCMVLGFMLALQFRTARDIKESMPLQRVEVLAERVQKLEAENEDLQAKLVEMGNAAEPEKSSVLAADALLLSGMLPVEGPGIILTIDDSTKTTSKEALKAKEDMNIYLIHDEDLLKVINELKAAGAEAISLNGQRLTANSEIRCAGPTVSVNNVRSAPPFEIRAIGNSKDLENAINMRGGVADALKVWGINLEIKTMDNIWIPGYKSNVLYKYAKQSDRQEETP